MFISREANTPTVRSGMKRIEIAAHSAHKAKQKTTGVSPWFFIIDIFIESRYPDDRKRIRESARETLKKAGLLSKVVVSISIVGDRKMAGLNKKYRGKKGTTPVLAFPFGGQANFINPPDNILRLGEVVVSYPQAREIAKEKNKLVNKVIEELIEHGISKVINF